MKLPRPTWITVAFALGACLLGGAWWKTALLLLLAALSLKWPGPGRLGGKSEEE